MTLVATSTTTLNTKNLASTPASDLKCTNASIFRDALSEPVIRSLVSGGNGDRRGKRGGSARERRLRRKGRTGGMEALNGRDNENGGRMGINGAGDTLLGEKKELGVQHGIVDERQNRELLDEDEDVGAENRSDMEDLGDFIDYLSSEIFTSLPEDLCTITYASMQDDEHLASKYQLPLSNPTVEDISSTLPASIADSLLTYDLFPQSTSSTSLKDPYQTLTTFLHPILTTYISTTTAPPLSPSHPSWRATRAVTSACELCGRDWVPLTYHHLIPRSTHARVLKRGWHRPEMLNVVAWLCRPCHDTVHRVVPSNEELARSWYSVELLMGREDVRRFVGWVGRVRGLAR